MSETTDRIEWKALPPIQGLSLRHLNGAADYPAMAAITNRCFQVDKIDAVMTEQELTADIENVSPDAPQEFVVVQVNDEIVGWGQVRERQDQDGSRQYISIGFIAPEWRRRGIGGALLEYQEFITREMARPHAGQNPQFYRSPASDERVGKIAMLERAGYGLLRVFNDMLRPNLDNLPDAPMPSGLELRPFLPEHYRPVWEAMDEAFREHFGHTPQTETDYQAWFESPNFDPTLHRIAWDGDRVAGMAMNITYPELNANLGAVRGIVEALGVQRPWRRRGLGRALLVSSLRAFQEHGMTEAWLGVDTENENRALHLYESAGFRLDKRHLIYAKPILFAEL